MTTPIRGGHDLRYDDFYGVLEGLGFGEGERAAEFPVKRKIGWGIKIEFKYFYSGGLLRAGC